MSREQFLYEFAKDFLKSKDERINNEIIDSHLSYWNVEKLESMKDVFQKLLFHSTNYQGAQKNVKIDCVKGSLFNFDYNKILNHYEDDKELLSAFSKQMKREQKKTIKIDSKSQWARFAKSCLDSAVFCQKFKDIHEFNSFIKDYTSDPEKVHLLHSLPMFLSSQIHGLGLALALDFCKEHLGVPFYAKPDVHIKYLFSELELTDCDNDDYLYLQAVINFSKKVPGSTPYGVDKLFWLIGSGNFHANDFNIGSNREEFISKVKRLEKVKIANKKRLAFPS